MGFNLLVFFEELESILNLNMNNDEMLVLLEETIIKNKQYAKDCGLLNE